LLGSPGCGTKASKSQADSQPDPLPDGEVGGGRQTCKHDKTIIDRTSDLKNWVDILKEMVNDKKIRKLFAFANNHFGGHGPATVKLFWDLWEKR
jgi:hypothetical protein